MKQIIHVRDALIDGGVTDGTNTVRYEDVISVDFRMGGRSYLVIGVSGVFVLIGIFALIDEGFSLPALLSTAFFGLILYQASRLSQHIVRVRTASGRIKLKYAAISDAEDALIRPFLHEWLNSWPICTPQIGMELAKIINSRKGRLMPPGMRDVAYTVVQDPNLPMPEFFRIHRDSLTVLRQEFGGSIHEGETVSLAGLQSVETRFRQSVGPTTCRGPQDRAVSSEPANFMEDDVILRFENGVTTTHFIRTTLAGAKYGGPAAKLAEALRDHLRPRIYTP